jgi:hypothetical protein
MVTKAEEGEAGAYSPVPTNKGKVRSNTNWAIH